MMVSKSQFSETTGWAEGGAKKEASSDRRNASAIRSGGRVCGDALDDVAGGGGNDRGLLAPPWDWGWGWGWGWGGEGADVCCSRSHATRSVGFDDSGERDGDVVGGGL